MSIDTLEVTLIEKELINVELIEKELIKIELSTIDIIHTQATSLEALEDVNIINPLDGQIIKYDSASGKWINTTVSEIVDLNIVQNETPIVVTAPRRYSTAYAYTLESLQVFLNGVKIHNSEIIIHSSTEFSYPIDIVVSDMLEVSYMKA